ncbi:glycosyltransferase family 4 protein [Adhaeribacter sp. BT258]|uniref:Glycosyltransferase family 4 protein n=1 Tax=Adhaeribacter terrigena TaxID=2793070 RepID=A0ABS1BW96_9BACT|nr:glycosyltransferase family 4 protein [Adhaeribacter terrigena]MBK0401374.1 glycosyltransferase family 4 protein [Adhaeribacter terrigena]
MNILHVSSEKTWRGGEQQIAYLIEELRKNGENCFVACRKNTPFEEYCKKQNLPHVALPFANEFDLYTASQLKKYCAENRIDLVHAHSSHSHGLSVWGAVLGNKPPIILSRRVDFPVKKNWFSKFKYNYKGIKRVICVSEKIREITMPSLKRPQICVTVHSGIDLSRFENSKNTGKLHKEFNLPEHQLIIGNISAIAEQKDYFTFVSTAELLLQKGLHAKFFIIGDGPMRAEIEAFVKQKNLTAHIIFTGFRNDVPEILPELDVFLITSQTEGLGTTILDAFACRVPVVATRGGGIPEIVKEGETGLLANVYDTEQLAYQVQRVLTNEKLRQILTEQACRFLQNFRKENTAKRTLEIYRQVLAENQELELH